MAKYTTMIKTLVENKFPLALNDYPIYDECHRPILNEKILHHYYFREIGFETPALFNTYLRRKMHEIMPYYNQLYQSEKLVTEPLVNNDIKTVANAGVESGGSNDAKTVVQSTATGERKGETDNRTQASDTPQSKLEDIYSDEWVSSTSKAHSEDTQTSSTVGEAITNNHSVTGNTTISKYVNDVIGFSGRTQSEMLMEYRDTFVNIDMDIIAELDTLFMQIW